MIRPATCLCLVACAAAVEAPGDAELANLTRKAQNWMLAQAAEDGSFTGGEKRLGRFALGVTCIAVDALLAEPDAIPADDARIAAALDYILAHQQEDGGIYAPEAGLANYTTCVALQALIATGADEDAIERAQRFVIGTQNLDEDSPTYGGIPYGSRDQGNEGLNLTATAVAALRESGVPADDPAMRRALEFIERCQNLSSHNDREWAGNDGGAVQSPKLGRGASWQTEEDKARAAAQEAAGAQPSDGAMTYQLIKSYRYLDFDEDDPRLRAAVRWIGEHFSAERVPGRPDEAARQGLFNYYQITAKTHAALGVDPEGVDWRPALAAAIAGHAQEAGDEKVFWINADQKYGEGVPHIVTAYMIAALKDLRGTDPE